MLSIVKNTGYFIGILLVLICAGCVSWLPGHESFPIFRQVKPLPPGPVCRVAVLPFVSDSDYPLADVLVSKIFATEFQKSGNFVMIQDGDVLQAYRQLRIRPGMTPTVEQLQVIADRIGAQYLISGIVMEMRVDRVMHRGVDPEITLQVQLRDGRSGQVLWTVLHRRRGSDYTKVMHFGKIDTVTGLSRQMAIEIINLWLKKGLTQCSDVSPQS